VIFVKKSARQTLSRSATRYTLLKETAALSVSTVQPNAARMPLPTRDTSPIRMSSRNGLITTVITGKLVGAKIMEKIIAIEDLPNNGE